MNPEYLELLSSIHTTFGKICISQDYVMLIQTKGNF